MRPSLSLSLSLARSPSLLSATTRGADPALAALLADQDAAANLQRARLEARERGHEKRDAIKRRVEELRRVQAFDRARDVQAVEQGKSGTGHLALPAPAPAQSSDE